MAGFADLEISLHRRDADSYTVELRYSSLKSDADIWRVQDRAKPLRFDFEQLRAHALEYDVAAYGKVLTQHLFADESIKLAFAQARSATQAQAALRFRLFIDPTAPELHSLRWETLQDPQTGDLLFTGEHLLFSRYLSSQDWREARLRPRMSLKALVVIANPAHLDRYQLAPIDVDGEFVRAQAGLGDIQITPLKSLGSANVNNVFDHLRDGDGYDILYLVCHGTLSKGEPWLWLEDPDGNVARLSGDELATRMNELQQPPRLVVLLRARAPAPGRKRATAIEARSRQPGRVWQRPAFRQCSPCRVISPCRPSPNLCPSSSKSCSAMARSIGQSPSPAGQCVIGLTGGCRCCTCASRAGAFGMCRALPTSARDLRSGRRW